MDYKIHIAFGFHVNCYHSYRGDTNDEQGFGSDLRIIRKIIETLDRLNREGIPVKGTWDSENFFSLEQILPEYAPDIIEGMKRRANENGDENIIMGYSNGALSAMQEDELEASIKLAVKNEQKSGLEDIFGRCEMIVRPQEVMFTPSQVHTYNKLGVKALCLYYSCVPFDAFKTLIPLLDDEKAFNPLTFEYKGEGLTVIPTYSNADICDAGCLRAWVKDLRKKQVSGEIKNDLFLFVNMDADAIFWESLNLPVIGNRIANTDGINGLVREIADLDFIVFDTPGGYLKNHKPVGKIQFTQDTADGNFTGYASWAEKPYNRKIWTAIERSRTAGRINKNSEDFLNRVKLLSTTHFGLATPVLNIQREEAANALSQKLIKASTDKNGKLIIHNTAKSRLQCLQLSCKTNSGIVISADGLEKQTVVPLGDNSVFVMLRFSEIKDEYEITATECENTDISDERFLESGKAKLTVENDCIALFYDGELLGELSTYITYEDWPWVFNTEEIYRVAVTGGKCIEARGRINLPNEIEAGSFSYRFFTADAVEGIFVITDVKYPYTPEKDAISTENSTLGRYTDMKWSEAVPFGITFKNGGEVSVIKRNFEGDISTFRTASYGEADEKNKALDSFNNQLTAGLVGLKDEKRGLLVFNARNVLSSMAFCPMRLYEDGSVTMNPFGTFFGKQRHHNNRSGDRIPLTYTLIAPQGKSLAPSYNGSRESAVICLLPFEKEMPKDEKLNELLAFSDGAFATGSDRLLSPFEDENVSVRKVDKKPENVKIHSPLMSSFKGNLGKYIVRGTRALSYIIRRQKKAKK
ncbi:MAG: hypothetical protein E7515_08990 [Ruminococcaceae bacterium]|nr:hypothetical protein [Oscillospiraceae bacterium]